MLYKLLRRSFFAVGLNGCNWAQENRYYHYYILYFTDYGKLGKYSRFFTIGRTTAFHLFLTA